MVSGSITYFVTITSNLLASQLAVQAMFTLPAHNLHRCGRTVDYLLNAGGDWLTYSGYSGCRADRTFISTGIEILVFVYQVLCLVAAAIVPDNLPRTVNRPGIFGNGELVVIIT